MQQPSVFPSAIRSGDAVLDRSNGERHQVVEIAIMLRLRDAEGWRRATDFDKIVEPWYPPKVYIPGTQQWRAPPGAAFVGIGVMTLAAGIAAVLIWL